MWLANYTNNVKTNPTRNWKLPCHIYKTHGKQQSKHILKGGAAISTPPPATAAPPPRDTHSTRDALESANVKSTISWNTSESTLVFSMRLRAWNQGADTGYRRQKKMCNTCFSKSLTFQNMNCWNSLKFRIPRPKETNCDVLDGLLYLWLVDTTMKRKLFWLKLADLQLCI